MQLDTILERISSEEMFQKLMDYVGRACFDPGEFKELG